MKDALIYEGADTRTDKDQADAFSNWGRVRAATCLLCKGYI